MTAASIPFIKDMAFEYGVAQEIIPGVRRIVAPNPSPFTFKGTNTYIIGYGEVALIDPGPLLEQHIENIKFIPNDLKKVFLIMQTSAFQTLS